MASRTEKNEPLWQFMTDDCLIRNEDNSYRIEPKLFREKYDAVSHLFNLTFKE
jgi:hypothetical protein